jgi:hypothetical protein
MLLSDSFLWYQGADLAVLYCSNLIYLYSRSDYTTTNYLCKSNLHFGVLIFQQLQVLFGGGGVELQASATQGSSSTTWATPSVHFALVILEMRSPELFALAGLDPQSSSLNLASK